MVLVFPVPVCITVRRLGAIRCAEARRLLEGDCTYDGPGLAAIGVRSMRYARAAQISLQVIRTPKDPGLTEM